MIYECTIMGGNGGSTVFRGPSTSSLMFFNCTGDKEKLILTHSHFNRPQGTKRSCNNGTIIAQSLHGANGTYISQLSITVTSKLIGDVIECAHDNGSAIEVIGMAIINDTGVHMHDPYSYYFSA